MSANASLPVSVATEDVAGLLTRHGIKTTPQRLVVARALLAQPTHLTAEQILAMVRETGERISKATVYNTLKALVQSGLVRQINLDPTRSVYDSTAQSHHHFHDMDSGQLWDIDPADIQFSRMPALPEGMEAAGVEVVIRLRRRSPGIA
jgi:Fur family transcriptional regulator, iron response regulator